MNTHAIHLIWTTYGSWLPGDPRGHWSPLFDFYGKLRLAGHQLNMPDATTMRVAKDLCKEPPKLLAAGEVTVVAQTIGEMVDDSRRQEQDRRHAGGYISQTIIPGLCVRAAAIEHNHVHLLIDALTIDIATVAGKLKSRSSSAVLQKSGHDRQRTWTSGYWRVFLFDDEAVAAVREYIANHNIRRGLPPAPFAWII